MKRKEEHAEDGSPEISFVRASDLLERNLRSGLNRDTDIYSGGWESPFDEVYNFRDQLMEDYSGASLAEALEGDIVENEFGSCYRITTEYPIVFSQVDESHCNGQILSDLTLVCGIGPHYQDRLRSSGYSDIPGLLKHPKWGPQAREFLDILQGQDITNLHRWMWRFLPKTHPLVYLSSGLLSPQDFAVFDIESMGLFESPIILFGIGKQVKGCVQVIQYLLTDISDEPAALLETIKELQRSEALISFNGRAFDFPYLRDRLGFYGLEVIEEPPHFDLLHYTRRFLGGTLTGCSLGEVESYLGVEREVDLPSEMVPHFYERYLDTGNPGPLIPIVEHNKQDLVSLVSLFNKFHEMLT